jgi:hypothetical protein
MANSSASSDQELGYYTHFKIIWECYVGFSAICTQTLLGINFISVGALPLCLLKKKKLIALLRMLLQNKMEN